MPGMGPPADAMMEAHGIINSVAWAILAPLGAILIRVVPSTKAWIIHGGVMIFALLVFTAGYGMGVAKVLAYGSHVSHTAHFLLGTILFALAWMQPFIGTAHHFIFKATGKRTLLSAYHVFFGRLFILIGVINGGIGLLLADNTTRAENIAYGTVVGIVWMAYVLVSLQMEVKRQQAKSVKAASFSESEEERVVESKS